MLVVLVSRRLLTRPDTMSCRQQHQRRAFGRDRHSSNSSSFDCTPAPKHRPHRSNRTTSYRGHLPSIQQVADASYCGELSASVRNCLRPLRPGPLIPHRIVDPTFWMSQGPPDEAALVFWKFRYPRQPRPARLGDCPVLGSHVADPGRRLETRWRKRDAHPIDLDGDGIVNGADLSYVLGYWGLCSAP